MPGAMSGLCNERMGGIEFHGITVGSTRHSPAPGIVGTMPGAA